MKNSMLIVLTGIDGSGKTTQAELLLDTMKKDGIPVSYVWSRWKPFLLRPFIKRWKQNVTKGVNRSNVDDNFKKTKATKRKLLSNPVFMWLWLTAFLVDYGIQIFLKIRIRQFSNKLILSDRMFHDSVIDQAINLGSKKDWLLNNIDSAFLKIIFPKPDMVLYIDLPGDVAFSRKDDAPNIEYLSERRELYKYMAEKYGWTVIDGTLSIDEIASEIKDKIYNELAL